MNDRSVPAKDKCDRHWVGSGANRAPLTLRRHVRRSAGAERRRSLPQCPQERIDFECDRTRRDANILACADRLIPVRRFDIGANQPGVDGTRECGIPFLKCATLENPSE